MSFQYPFSNAPYLWFGTRVFPFNGRNKEKLYRLTVWLRVLLKLKKINNENNVIGLFSFWCTECALVGTWFSKYSGIKHLSWISGQDAGKDNRFIPFIRPKAAELIAMSDFLAKEFYRNHGLVPAAIIPNGIDPAQFPAMTGKRDIDISAAGSLIPLKQYEVFIDVIKELTQHIPTIKTVICGKGPEEKNLHDQIVTWQLENNITLAGEQPHRQVLQVMQRSKVFLHPSTYEGFSSVCLEALYAGTHVISFWNPGAGNIKHWHIVSSKDEMVHKALEILLSPETDHEPVLAYTMNDSARAVMQFFNL